MSLYPVPITRAEADAFIRQHHRHHAPPNQSVFRLGVASGDTVRGVLCAGRPVSPAHCDGWTLEVQRTATDGTPNACSFLLGRAWRVARGLGFRRLITYTLPEESGASLRGAGWRCVGRTTEVRGWSRPGRPRVDTHPKQVKLRWETGAPRRP